MSLLVQALVTASTTTLAAALANSIVPQKLPVSRLPLGHDVDLPQLLLNVVNLVVQRDNRRRQVVIALIVGFGVATRPLPNLMIKYIGTLVLRALRVVLVVALASSGLVVNLAGARVRLCVTARPLSNLVIVDFSRLIRLGRASFLLLNAEPINPASSTVAIRTAQNVVAATRALA